MSAARTEAALDVETVTTALREVRDPELPLSVVDLGLIYDVVVDGAYIRVDMTLTSMGCPCHDVLVDDVRERLAAMPGVERAVVDIVWDPPWTSARITPAGREALANWGIGS